MINILILCTGNSALSILGEAILAQKGAGRIAAYSAGSKPKGVPHPGALRLLAHKGIDGSPFRSKSWDEFTAPDAPHNYRLRQCDERDLPGVLWRTVESALRTARPRPSRR